MNKFSKLSLRSFMPGVLACLLAWAIQPALADEVVVLDGPQAEAWRQAISQRATVSDVRAMDQVPEQATLIIPDRLLTRTELEHLKSLPRSVRVLAIGRSAYSENGSSAASVLGVGKHFQYIPLLYPAWLDYDMDRYKSIARWTAEQGAHGMGVFAYVHTLPDRSEAPNFEVIRDVFGAYESWKKEEVLDEPRSPGLKQTPLVLFMHRRDTLRAGPEEAVDWARKLNANTISVEVSRVRTRSVYPSQFTYEGEHEFQGRMVTPENDLDYLPRMLAAAEEADIAIHANIMTKHSPRPTEPHERQVMSSDFGSGEDPPREAPCPISGARHYDDMAAMVEEMLTKYPQIAAIELDEPRIYNRGWIDWACFCQGCNEVFKERYGYNLTPANVIDYPQFEDSEPDERRAHTTEGGRQSINADFQEFRTWMMNELLLEKFRRAINRVKPDTALVVWQPRTYEAFGFSPGAINYGVSVFGPEYMDGPGSPRYLNHPDTFYPRHERVVRAVDVQDDEAQSLDAEIVRVDLFHLAQPLLWGEAEDRSRWVLLSSAQDGRVMYVAFDPLRDDQAHDVLGRILNWIGN
ncbi:hypothetical protein ACERK3_11755 [Phycisphaerales bacterium AB-hyl4]|uniref:Uncharacterized protein n=1 Tax=Natronomicrosphaera hydrolytica TaxID=3242702 RepID=A0ABV4U720_9BACT